MIGTTQAAWAAIAVAAALSPGPGSAQASPEAAQPWFTPPAAVALDAAPAAVGTDAPGVPGIPGLDASAAEAAPPEPLVLSLPVQTLLGQKPMPARHPAAVGASPTPGGPPAPPAAPAPPLQVNVGVGFTVPKGDNPPVGISANLLGADPSVAAPVHVAGQTPYSTPGDVRTPDREVGVGLSYTLPNPDPAAPRVSVTGTYARSTFSPTQPLNQTEGTAGVRIQF